MRRITGSLPAAVAEADDRAFGLSHKGQLGIELLPHVLAGPVAQVVEMGLGQQTGVGLLPGVDVDAGDRPGVVTGRVPDRDGQLRRGPISAGRLLKTESGWQARAHIALS